MALLTAVAVTTSATEVAPAAMSTSDTISAATIGTRGALLNVINGGVSSVDFTAVDPGRTPVGNTVTAPAQAVANGTDRWFYIGPNHVDVATGVATVTLSDATDVDYKLIRL